MLEPIKKISVVGRSPTGRAVVSFENEQMAKDWLDKMPRHSITLFRQTIIEEEIQL